MEHSRVYFRCLYFSNRFLPDGIYYNMCCNRLLYWEEDFQDKDYLKICWTGFYRRVHTDDYEIYFKKTVKDFGRKELNGKKSIQGNCHEAYISA